MFLQLGTMKCVSDCMQTFIFHRCIILISQYIACLVHNVQTLLSLVGLLSRGVTVMETKAV